MPFGAIVPTRKAMRVEICLPGVLPLRRTSAQGWEWQVLGKGRCLGSLNMPGVQAFDEISAVELRHSALH